MPEPTDYVRVTDKDTGHHHTITRAELPHGNFAVLKQSAVDPLTLEPLPSEFPKSVETTTTSGQSAGTKES